MSRFQCHFHGPMVPFRCHFPTPDRSSGPLQPARTTHSTVLLTPSALLLHVWAEVLFHENYARDPGRGGGRNAREIEGVPGEGERNLPSGSYKFLIVGAKRGATPSWHHELSRVPEQLSPRPKPGCRLRLHGGDAAGAGTGARSRRYARWRTAPPGQDGRGGMRDCGCHPRRQPPRPRSRCCTCWIRGSAGRARRRERFGAGKPGASDGDRFRRPHRALAAPPGGRVGPERGRAGPDGALRPSSKWVVAEADREGRGAAGFAARAEPAGGLRRGGRQSLASARRQLPRLPRPRRGADRHRGRQRALLRGRAPPCFRVEGSTG
jgi:hypothetical protein